MTVRGVTNFARRMDRVDTSERGLTNIDREVSETQNQTARKLLKGCVTYAVQDDPEKGQVLVTIVSSPKTRGKYDRPGPDGISTDSLRDGLNMVITEIRNGLVPPVGGRIIEVPGTGEMAWVGFGSAIVRKDDEPDVQEELNLAAEEIAGMRAVDALAGIILGDDTRWEGHADEQTRRQVRDFERLQASDPTFRGAEDEIRVYEQRKKTMRSDQRSNTKVQSLRRGVLPPGIDPQVEMDEDGYFAYGIAVYIPSVSEMARQASREMDEAEIVRSPNSRGSRQQQNLKMKKGPSGIVEQNL